MASNTASTATPSPPIKSTNASNRSPPGTSASRTEPRGKIGDASHAITTDRIIAASATGAMRTSPSPKSCARVKPSARSVGSSSDAIVVSRTSAWPMMRTPVIAMNSPSSLSADDCKVAEP